MRRESLLQLLETYGDAHPAERPVRDRIRDLVASQPRCFERDCFHPGHITASSWILSADDRRVLLTHHRKLDRWLQLGGHADGDTDVLAVALREAREESGMERFECLAGEAVFDLDVHRIPARGREPAHEHHDLRFLLRATGDEPLVRSEESHDLRWFRAEELDGLGLDESVMRLARKAEQVLAARRGSR